MFWTSLQLIQWTAGYFEKKGIPNPRLDAELLLSRALRCQRIDLYTRHERKIPEKELKKFRELVERRAQREPLQYILGETEFWGLKIKLTPAVLIPRPETEVLVEEILKLKPKEILEIGTGSGCIGIAIAKNLPGSRIMATDISPEALELARENAHAHGVGDRIEFVLADIAPWKRFEATGTLFDLIVANPPYIPTGEFPNLQPEVRDFEPRRALDGGPDGLAFIRQILHEAPPFLKPSGLLLLEIGDHQGALIKTETGHHAGLSLEGIRKDLNGTERILILKKR